MAPLIISIFYQILKRFYTDTKYLNYERLPEYAKKPWRVEQDMWVIAATAPAIQAAKTIH